MTRRALGIAKTGLAGLIAVGAGALALPITSYAADIPLAGTVKSAAGETMGGVTVSARADGSTITTSVYTDEQGNYYFPPLPSSKYQVWAQALGYDYTESKVDLSAPVRQNFTLAALTDPEAKLRQLPGDVLLNALPASTDNDKKMVQIVRAVCVSCHTPSFILQNKFDHDGWNAILTTMQRTSIYGEYQPTATPNPDILNNQKELADYLTRIRGPGASELQITLPARPSGDAARVAVQDYKTPLDPELNLPADFAQNDGYNWTQGNPSVLIPGFKDHDAQLDLDGNIWYTISTLNHQGTLGRIDAKTGENKIFSLPGANGYAANAHGLTRDPSGNIWFGPTVGNGVLAKMDPKTEKITVYNPPSPTGMSVTLDADKQGNVWMSAGPSGAGVMRFDPVTTKFQAFSVGNKNDRGQTSNTSYGIAVDANGNAWWSLFPIDLVAKADFKSGQAKSIPDAWQPPAIRGIAGDTLGIRRMGADKNGNYVWIADSYAQQLTRIDVNTDQVTKVPVPFGLQPYHIVVDKDHNVWFDSWISDTLTRYNPATQTWTRFDMPQHGTEYRYVALLEREGQSTKVVAPSFRTRQMMVMTLRSQADIDAVKSQVPRDTAQAN
jgi:streptogramin lyase